MSLVFKMGLIFILSAIWGELSGIRKALEKIRKAEIERLEKSVKVHNAGIIHYKSLYKNAKSEAYKELGHFLIDRAENGVINTMDIPDYVKEMAGGE